MSSPKGSLPIGVVVKRTGVPASALRFYEAKGLIWSDRSEGDRRIYQQGMLRRISFIRVSQRVGLSLDEIKGALDSLPSNRTPTKQDWARLSRGWRPKLDEQIELLQKLKSDLTSCIGCGCLSLQSCRLYNPQDRAADLGTGPRYLLGDEPVEPQHA